ncbi:hypothetical protein AGMMS50230_10030 [Spirochaetia bacterium]|nr:hypothetical protein AGMMS50230_10030 [Spirochaetia bacterium]
MVVIAGGISAGAVKDTSRLFAEHIPNTGAPAIAAAAIPAQAAGTENKVTVVMGN